MRAEYALVFEDPPERLRKSGGRGVQVKDRHLQVVSDYVAPPSRRAHGAYVKYVVERCRCGPCRQANRDYENRRQRAMTRPDEVWAPYVPAGPARAHCRRLAEAGVGLKQVAKVSGVPHGSLSKLVYGDRARGMGPSKRVRKATADRILGVRESDLAAGARVDAGPTWALIDELVKAGYWKVWIARRIGQTGPGLQLSRRWVSVRNVRAVAEVHGRYIDLKPPARPSRWSK